ncbi:hypothetical protein [Levilactobacillus namurensis]|uniref:hypothetical protein n=1 Tax=Levilactobacillus namurensis TaxID=380393 RepID=UPI001DB2A01D|nr:hypothetical protein [Levilactobacillus namurensis]HJE45690.1 hypothetical protein [Levilactobacillus namurensis]
MGFLSRIFGQHSTPSPEVKQRQADIHSETDPKYLQAIMSIPTYWKQYEESLRLIRSTVHCDTYFNRKDFMIARLGLTQQLINYVGGSNTFIDEMTNTDITVSSQDIDSILQDLSSNNYDEQFIKRYSESLFDKVNSLKTPKAQLNNINKWQQWLLPYENKLSSELAKSFHSYCSGLEKNITQELNK